jgi:hypothetical protein
VALTAIVSSRIVIGVLIGWDAVVANILIALKPLGGWRNLVDETALNRLGPQNVTGDDVHTSVLTAIVVLVAWTAIAFAAGRMRTERRDA